MLKAREAVRNLPTYHPPLGGRRGPASRLQRKYRRAARRECLARLRELTAEEIGCYPEREPLGSDRGGVISASVPTSCC